MADVFIKRRGRASPILIGIVVVSIAVLIAVGVLTLLRRPAAAPPVLPAQLVAIGGVGPYQRACRSGLVGNLNASGDNFLALRGRPGRNEEKLAELGPDRRVLICDSASAGGQTWLGIVYGPDNPGRDCGVALPAPRPQPYRGPCGSGWVRARYVNPSP
ncbi:MAG: hypothetical protein QOD42_620 [Sphingomonadales bacterium]|jgi:hypothetical protein|nr:hypothetical protein [Sphingomonadales bacterium]